MGFPIRDERIKHSSHQVKPCKVYLTVLLPSVHLLLYPKPLVLHIGARNIGKKDGNIKKEKEKCYFFELYYQKSRNHRGYLLCVLPKICRGIVFFGQNRSPSLLPWLLQPLVGKHCNRDTENQIDSSICIREVDKNMR